MASGILKPLAVFCSQSQSQQYIKSVRNLGDAWRTLAEKPPTDPDGSTVIETTFDFVLEITFMSGQRPEFNATPSDIKSVEMKTHGHLPPSQTIPLRHYRIVADYGTDFVWRQVEDIKSGEDSHVDVDEVLSEHPSSVLNLYDAWVDTYSTLFKERCEDTQDYSATVFPTVSEEVAWHVAGYLLAWRIVMGPGVGSVEYSTGRSKYMLERGKETGATLDFLTDQVEILARGELLE